MHKLSFYVPESHLESVKQALFDAGAGQHENYDLCCWQTKGIGQFRPINWANPFIWENNKLEKLEEWKVEIVCSDKKIKNVIATLFEVHPYEEVSYDVYKIETLLP